MQTLRSRRSPCKYKNEPSRFLGEGMTFKAKLIGILEVNEARGDKMCQDALNDLKTAIRAAGEHKQRITISIAIDGLRLRDEKTGDSLYHHPVHKISFIAQDMSDSRAFGYIFGSPDTGHRFFGIKTDKSAGQVVIAMRDLFQVVFELKKKEIEQTKRHIELRQRQFLGDDNKEETDVDKGKSDDINKPSSSNTNQNNSKNDKKSEAIADLLFLEDELNSIQQGISQMERITPSDPFGPLSLKGETFLDSFKVADVPRKASSIQGKDLPESENSTNVIGSAASTNSRAVFFPSQSPLSKSKEEQHWFDQETESLFKDAVPHLPEASTSPVTFHTPTGDGPDQDVPGEKMSPVAKLDLFRDLDPLGTGKTKPYVDKKDFFQELKNPPKKVLKELITEPISKPEPTQFPADFDSAKIFSRSVSTSSYEPGPAPTTLSHVTTNLIDSFSKDSKYSKIDPFEETDPFGKADPFLEDSYPKSIGFPSRASMEGLRISFRPERPVVRSPEEKCISPKPSIFSSGIHGPLRVSLPPEKPDLNTTISLSSLASRFRSSPSPTEESKTLRRKYYQTLKHSFEDKSDDQSNSPILEEVYVRSSPKPYDKKILIGSPPPARTDRIKSKISSSLEVLDSTPDPPPRPKTTLFAIKPPPLPPKKQNQPNFRPPARPPSLEDNFHYDFLRQKEISQKSENQTSPKKCAAFKRQNSCENVTIPALPKPPQRKSSVGSDTPTTSSVKSSSPPSNPSVLNITLNQLDKSGIESIASSLGIPLEKVCNMTLQELTKMLANKYLGPEEVSQPNTEAFHADFESNFSTESNGNFDKYAVFKELIQEENSGPVSSEICLDQEESVNQVGQEAAEDKYAALRHLSLSAQKSENLSEDLEISYEDDSSCRADNISDIVKQTDESFTPLEVASDSPKPRESTGEGWNNDEKEDKTESTTNEIDVAIDNNWATFQKEEEVGKIDLESPLSSDGKETPSAKVVGWGKIDTKPSDLPWRDDDESWDDQSAKESYWSESSHDGQSPTKENLPYLRKSWNKHSSGRHHCQRRWVDDTEDEYDMRRRRPPHERFRDFKYEWGREWEAEKRIQDRRKTSVERRHRCDSDLSDKEYTSREIFDHKPTGKSKHYYHGREMLERHWSDTRESRSRYKRPSGSKRPSSASDSRRLEKYSTMEHADKRESDDDDYLPKFRPSRKDFRYHSNIEHYGSYDRRAQATHHRRIQRGKRSRNEEFDDSKWSESRHFLAPETPRSANSEDTPEPTKELHFKFEDDFIPSPSEIRPHFPEPERCLRDDWGRKLQRKPISTTTPDNKNETFASFDDNFAPHLPKEEDGVLRKPSLKGRSKLGRQDSSASMRKSESINIFSRESDPFEDDEFFSSGNSGGDGKLSKFPSEKSRSNTNVCDPFAWKEKFTASEFED